MKKKLAGCFTLARRNKGVSLVEMVLAVALTTLLILGVIKLMPLMFKFSARGQARQQAAMEGRRCLETIERVMSTGRARTLAISTPATTPVIPRSQARFSATNGALYTIRWSDTPMNTVHLQRTPPGGGAVNDTLLASNVTALVFDIPDAADPSMVNVGLQIRVALSAPGTPDNLYTVNLPQKSIEMVAD